MTQKRVRSVRNNNPLNIERRASNPWQGLMPAAEMTEEQKRETRFEVFKAPEWGFRAGARILITFQDRHGIRTIEGIVKRFAPAEDDNDVEAYIAAVESRSGFERDEILDLHQHEFLRPVLEAMAFHETGARWPAAVIDKGLALAGMVEPLKPRSKSRTLTGAAGAGTAVALSSTVDQAKDLLGQYQDVIPWVKYALLGLGFVSIGLVVYAYLDDRRKRVT